MTTTMKAAVVPAAGARWVREDVPKPEAGPHQALVRIHASGVCYTDALLAQAGLSFRPFPLVLGHGDGTPDGVVGYRTQAPAAAARTGASGQRAGGGPNARSAAAITVRAATTFPTPPMITPSPNGSARPTARASCRVT